MCTMFLRYKWQVVPLMLLRSTYRKTWGKCYRGEVRLLPNRRWTRVYPLRLVGSKGEMRLYFVQRDIYCSAWVKIKKKDELDRWEFFIFKDVIKDFQKEKEEAKELKTKSWTFN